MIIISLDAKFNLVEGTHTNLDRSNVVLAFRLSRHHRRCIVDSAHRALRPMSVNSTTDRNPHHDHNHTDTEIDWETYMAQVNVYAKGQRDYAAIEGPTGPLV